MKCANLSNPTWRYSPHPCRCKGYLQAQHDPGPWDSCTSQRSFRKQWAGLLPLPFVPRAFLIDLITSTPGILVVHVAAPALVQMV